MGGRKSSKGKIPKPNIKRARRFAKKGQKGSMSGMKAGSKQARIGSAGY